MLSACSSINRGLETALAAERAADRDAAALVAKHEVRARDRHAALRAMGERLERQSGGVLRQQAAVERLSAALRGPHGLQDRLTHLQETLRGLTADLTLIAERQGRAACPAGPVPTAGQASREGGEPEGGDRR